VIPFHPVMTLLDHFDFQKNLGIFPEPFVIDFTFDTDIIATEQVTINVDQFDFAFAQFVIPTNIVVKNLTFQDEIIQGVGSAVEDIFFIVDRIQIIALMTTLLRAKFRIEWTEIILHQREFHVRVTLANAVGCCWCGGGGDGFI
jgi:hypothetical protein